MEAVMHYLWQSVITALFGQTSVELTELFAACSFAFLIALVFEASIGTIFMHRRKNK